MSLRLRCPECGAVTRLPDTRYDRKNYCPRCDARLPDEPTGGGGGGLVIALVLGGVALAGLCVVGAGVVFWLLADRPAAGPEGRRLGPAVAEGPDAYAKTRPGGAGPVAPDRRERRRRYPAGPPVQGARAGRTDFPRGSLSSNSRRTQTGSPRSIDQAAAGRFKTRRTARRSILPSDASTSEGASDLHPATNLLTNGSDTMNATADRPSAVTG